MLRLLVNILSAKSGGAVSYVRNLIPRLQEGGRVNDSIQALVLCDATQKRVLDSCGQMSDAVLVAPTVALPALGRLRWERRELPKLVTEHAIDVLFTPYQVSTAITNAREVIMVRNMEPFLGSEYTYGVRGRIRNFLIRRATVASCQSAWQIIAVSEFVREYLQQHIGIESSRITRIYHGRDTFFEADENSGHTASHDGAMFLTCGSLLPYRRCEDVIKAFAVVAKRCPRRRLSLKIAGEGTEAKYRALLDTCVSKSGCSELIEFVGHVPKEQMRRLFRGCLACILSTEIEACPNTAIEALTSGCAIIASDAPPLPEILGTAPLYYPRRNVDELVKRMIQILEDPGLGNRCREAAAMQARCFDWNVCAQQTLALLSSI
jgi:glycosyltransferase involved in cell wall biosynthesis